MRYVNQPRGFSLLELIVSLGIFSFVMLAVTGAYLTLIDVDRRTRASNQLSSSLAFAVESMARSIRTGSDYEGGGNTIAFMDSQGQRVSFILRSDKTIGQCIGGGSCLSANAVPLTGSGITIETLQFFVRGVGVGDRQQPNVTFVIAGSMVADGGEETEFTIQSGATQRIIEL